MAKNMGVYGLLALGLAPFNLAAAQPVAAGDGPDRAIHVSAAQGASTWQQVDAAFEAMKNGQYHAAVARLEPLAARRDPSQLINLGTAYARLGLADRAAAAYRAAETSDLRCDVELADGTLIDSRRAARLALAALASGRAATPAIALR